MTSLSGDTTGDAFLDGAALDDERARRGHRIILDLFHVIGVIRIVGVLGLSGRAQLSLLAVEACQFDLKVRAGGVLPSGTQGRLVDGLVAQELLDESEARLDKLQIVELAELGAQGSADLLVVLRAARQASQVGVHEHLRVEVGAGSAVACHEGDEFVDTRHDLVGDAEVGEAVVRVVDAASGREVRLEAAQLDLKGLVEEGAVVPRCDAQDVGVVRGGSDFRRYGSACS